MDHVYVTQQECLLFVTKEEGSPHRCRDHGLLFLESEKNNDVTQMDTERIHRMCNECLFLYVFTFCIRVFLRKSRKYYNYLWNLCQETIKE